MSRKDRLTDLRMHLEEALQHKREGGSHVYLDAHIRDAIAALDLLEDTEPVPMLLTCPSCGGRHLDVGDFATKAHHTHACQTCGMCWRPAVVPTVGVHFLPGFKNKE